MGELALYGWYQLKDYLKDFSQLRCEKKFATKAQRHEAKKMLVILYNNRTCILLTDIFRPYSFLFPQRILLYPVPYLFCR